MRLPKLAAFVFIVLCLAWPAVAVTPSAYPEFVDPNPAPGNNFGIAMEVLTNGNVAIGSPGDDFNAPNSGAAYLFNGVTGALMSTLRGTTANDGVGAGITVLTNGNFVVQTPGWDNGAEGDAGAVTWRSGTATGTTSVTSTNSTVGSSSGDLLTSTVVPLPSGHYVVVSPSWDNGAITNAGAVTWRNGTVSGGGILSAANSLVGSTASDAVGSGGVVVLTNGNYVARSPSWDNGAAASAGAVTWGSGTSVLSGAVSAANSLVGSSTNDAVGGNLQALTNGNYVVLSANWDNGAVVNAGAATWRSGTGGAGATVSAANSLVGSTAADNVGSSGAIALTNGNYVVLSPNWDNGGVLGVGAATWGNGAIGISGAVSAANSLVGFSGNDQVGSSGATALSNGNYVVRSPFWDNGAIVDAGAATWGNGAGGTVGAVTVANSVAGSTASDQVSGTAVTALTNGNYVVSSTTWDNGAFSNAGAATWGNGVGGTSGLVSAANSLVGTKASDLVAGGGATPLTNGNYVVISAGWDNGGTVNAGAVTWGNGTSGTTGVVSAANSLVGSTASDNLGTVTALTNGNYVVSSPLWDNGAVANAGAVTWGSGTGGVSGVVSAANSLVGSTVTDQVGTSVTPLPNGNYVAVSQVWDNGAISSAGHATWRSGTGGGNGVVSAANSLVGTSTGDLIGSSVTVLTDGNYVVASGSWDNGALGAAGAATWGDGSTGTTGPVTASNSLVGWATATDLTGVIANPVNNTFLCRFLGEGGGRVRVGPMNVFVVASAVDIPGDQGGWVRLSYARFHLDHPLTLNPVTTYGVWRHVPGTVPAKKLKSLRVGVDRAAVASLKAVLTDGIEKWEQDGRLFARRSGFVIPAVAFPPGTWELVMNVPAVQIPQYTVAVPTISNAASDDFVVTAHATTPSIWVITDPISGQSVDNLAPAQPSPFTGAYGSGATHLTWGANGEGDLEGYRLYRGTSAAFVPSLANRIATPSGTTFDDVGPAGRFYKLSAADVNGNESSFALLTPGATTDVESVEPMEFALSGAQPNPARGGDLNVAFALPDDAPAQLELLDVSGRRVRSREVGSLGTGRHVVNLAQGRSVPAGMYWLRLSQGAQKSRKRVVVIE